MLTIRPMLAAVLILVSTTQTRAQWRDYIVTLKNDTIYGELRFQLGLASSLESDQGTYPVDVNSVESYCSASHKELARRRRLPGKKRYQFLPVAESGLITLYAFHFSFNDQGKASGTFYAQKGDSALVEVWKGYYLLGNHDTTQRVALAALLSDNPAVRQAFDNDPKFEAIDVQYYIHQYNLSADPSRQGP